MTMVRKPLALLLAGGAFVIIITGSTQSYRFQEPMRVGWFVFAVVLAVVSFGMVVVPEVWPLRRVVKPSTPRAHVVAVHEAREALCAARVTAFDRWALVSIRHIGDRPLRQGTTAVAIYDPEVHGIVATVVGGSGFPLKSPMPLPAGINAPRPLHYLDVKESRAMRAVLRTQS